MPRSLGAVALVLIGASLIGARPASAGDEGERSFGLVDLSAAAERAPEGLKREVESWAKGRGLEKIADATMQRALGGPEPPGPAVARLMGEARAKKDADDCAAAVAKARDAETAALTTMTVDDEREPLKTVYELLIWCEHKLGHAELARAAGARLRTLVSLPPSALPRELWDRYVPVVAADGGAPSDAGAAAEALVELIVDSDPPNARVAINFHIDGVTPRTLKVHPGVTTIEIEKAGFKKAFRKITVEKKPERVVFALADRRQDRAAQVESAVTRLRGSDPAPHPTTLARLAELARVDVLVAIAVNAGTVKLWWFNADRGDLVGDPIEARFDPKTGHMSERLAAPRPDRTKTR